MKELQMLRAREKMAHAASMAGLKLFANAFLGICHSMSAHKLGDSTAYHTEWQMHYY